MDLMDLIENWKKIAGMNKPTLPGQPSMATPPFVPKPGESSPAQPPAQSLGLPSRGRSDLLNKPPAMEPGGPSMPSLPPRNRSDLGGLKPIQTPDRAGRFPEVSVPERQKVGIDSILPEVQTPKRDPIYANNEIWKMNNVDKPWHKDGDFMNELGGRLSNAFGSLTMRGNSPGDEKANMLKIAGAQQNRKKNKTMDALMQSNPELASKLLDMPAESREKYMELAMRQSFGDIRGASSEDPAAVQTYKFFAGLDDDEQREFMNLKRAGNVVTRPDGSVIYRNADGSWTEAVSPKEALDGAAALGSAETSGVELTNRFMMADSAAKSAEAALPGLYKQLALADGERAEGLLAPLEAWKAEIKAELGFDSSEATTNQLLNAAATKNVMDWFQDSGLGARGMDTPAEFARFIEGIAGTQNMTNDAYKQMIQKLIDEKQRAITDFNGMLGDEKYSGVYARDGYSRYEIPSRSVGSGGDEGDDKDGEWEIRRAGER